MLAIIQDVVFPIMQYNEADATLWEEDPIQYIQTKLGKFIREFNMLFENC